MERNKKKLSVIFMTVFFSLFFAFGFKTEVRADAFSDAKSLYEAYPNDVVYHDGYLYCGASGKKATSGTRYRTIGWRATVYDGSAAIQNVYFSLDSNSKFKELTAMTVNGREYNWYRIDFGVFKGSFNSTAQSVMNKSSCKIKLNAVMCLKIDGVNQGKIYDSSDNINKTGTVYTDYAGISGAAGWDDTVKKDLESRFNKDIKGIYVTLTVNKGTGISSTTGQGTYLIGSRTTVSATASTGYMVDYWTNEQGSNVKNGSSYTLPSMYTNRTVNVYGKVNKFTVKYDANGGTGAPGNQTKTYNVNLPLSGTKPTKKGHRFANWYSTANGAYYNSGGSYAYNADTTMKAQWNANIYEVKYYPNKPNAASSVPVPASMTNSSHIYGVAKALTSNAYSLTGWSFVNWTSNADGSGTKYDNCASVINLTATHGATVPIYAKWKPNVYTLILDNQYATVSGTTAVYEKYDHGWYKEKAATTSISTITIPQKTGMKFSGYYTGTNGTGTQYIDASGKIVVSNHSFTTDNMRVYAYWTPNVYEIKLDNREATTSGTTKIYERYSDAFYSSNTCTTKITMITPPTKDNYVFDGYWTEINEYNTNRGQIIIDSLGVIKDVKTFFKSDSTIYAKWIPVDYKINLNNQGADIDKGSTAFYEKYGEYNYTSSGNYDVNTGITTVRFDYTGNVQYFIAPADGEYTLNVAGAQGGVSDYGKTLNLKGGLGGTSSGKISLKKGDVLSIYVGQEGYQTGNAYNGGGVGMIAGTYERDKVSYGGGGGATDIRKNGTSLSNRIIVAGGGGGCVTYGNHGVSGASGGGTTGGTLAYVGWADAWESDGTTPKTVTGTSSIKSASQAFSRDPNASNCAVLDTSTSTYCGDPVNGGLGQGGFACGGGYYGGTFYMGTGGNLKDGGDTRTVLWARFGGGGGSGYIGGVTNGSMTTGTNSGNGWATISYNAKAILQYSVVEKYFNYTGNVQTFIAPVDGEYLLEVAGAQGGSTYGTGGLGGTSSGKISLKKGDTLQIYVGNQPVGINGGYNGGGVGFLQSNKYIQCSGGGGATDIRKGGSALSNRIIVAGGGGGGSIYLSKVAIGGTGGGTQGGPAGCVTNNGTVITTNTTGATQSSSYTYKTEKISNTLTDNFLGDKTFYYGGSSSLGLVAIYHGKLGQGWSSENGARIAGGGGGYYGGASMHGDNYVYGAFGGSGYVGGVTNDSMSTGTNKGNGWAKITYMDYSPDSTSICSIRVPQKNGYIFDGYWTGTNGTGKPVIDSSGTVWKDTKYFNKSNTVNKEATIYAKWIKDPTTESFSFNYVDGSNTISDKVKYGSNYTVRGSDTFSKEGYTFNGWNEQPDGTGKSWTYGKTYTYNIMRSTTVYAQWKANTTTKYVVNHYKQNLDGKTYTKADTENKTGSSDSEVTVSPKTYTGFTLNKDKTTVSPSGVKNSNGTVTVKIQANGTTVVDFYYTRDIYTVTLNKGTGISSVAGAGKYMYGATVDISAACNIGYSFTEWTTADVTLTDKTNYNTKFTMPAKNVTATANAKIVSHTLTVNPNGGQWVDGGTTYTSSKDFTMNYGNTKSVAKPTRVGYEPTWEMSYKTEPPKPDDINGKFENNIFTMGTRDTILTARWIPVSVSCKVNHYLQNLDGSFTLTETDTLSETADSQITVNPKGFEGYSVITDKTTSSPAGTRNTNGSIKVKVNPDSTTVVSFFYARNSYKVELVAGTGIASTSTSNANGYYKHGETVTIDATLKTGYKWVGWLQNSGPVLTLLNNTDLSSKKVQFTMPMDNVKLSAVAELENYDITYDLDGGYIPNGKSNPTSYTIETATFTLLNPVREGYTFAGWTGSNGTTPQKTVSIAKGSTGNKSYKANWTANTYNIVFNSNKPARATNSITGTMATQKITYGVETPLSKNNYLLTGWEFVGWNTKADGTGFAFGDDGTADDTGAAIKPYIYEDQEKVKNLATSGTLTLYAIWSENSYKIVYNKNFTNGGISYIETYSDSKVMNWKDSVTLKYEDKVTLPSPYISNGEKTVANFTGWNTASALNGTNYSAGATVSKLTATKNGTVNLYAKWKDIIAPTIVAEGSYGWFEPGIEGGKTLTFTASDIGGSGLNSFNLYNGSGTLLASGTVGANRHDATLTYKFTTEGNVKYKLVATDNSGNSTNKDFYVKIAPTKWQASISKINGDISFGINPSASDTFKNKTNAFNAIRTEFSITSALNPMAWESVTSAPVKFKEYGDMNAYIYTNVDSGYYNTVSYDFDNSLNALGIADISNVVLTDLGSGAGKNAQRIILPSTLEFDKDYTITVTIQRNDGTTKTQTLKFRLEHLDISDIMYRIRTQ